MGFNLMYYFSMGGLYFFMGSNLEKLGKFWRIRPDWGNTAQADMAGLGSIGLMSVLQGVGAPTQIEGAAY